MNNNLPAVIIIGTPRKENNIHLREIILVQIKNEIFETNYFITTPLNRLGGEGAIRFCSCQFQVNFDIDRISIC